MLLWTSQWPKSWPFSYLCNQAINIIEEASITPSKMEHLSLKMNKWIHQSCCLVGGKRQWHETRPTKHLYGTGCSYIALNRHNKPDRLARRKPVHPAYILPLLKQNKLCENLKGNLLQQRKQPQSMTSIKAREIIIRTWNRLHFICSQWIEFAINWQHGGRVEGNRGWRLFTHFLRPTQSWTCRWSFLTRLSEFIIPC